MIILIDGGTFSAAADFCAVMHHLKRATFVGEETGGGYFGNNSGLMPRITLPNSGFQVRLPMYEYWTAVSERKLAKRGTISDYVVPKRIQALIQGVDEPLECAKQLALGSTK